jgi:hypothetical protein
MIHDTGGLGTIGAHTARALVELGLEVVVTSHRRAEVPSFLAGRVIVEAIDVTAGTRSWPSPVATPSATSFIWPAPSPQRPGRLAPLGDDRLAQCTGRGPGPGRPPVRRRPGRHSGGDPPANQPSLAASRGDHQHPRLRRPAARRPDPRAACRPANHRALRPGLRQPRPPRASTSSLRTSRASNRGGGRCVDSAQIDAHCGRAESSPMSHLLKPLVSDRAGG